MQTFTVTPATSRAQGLPDASFALPLHGLHGASSPGAYLRASGPPGGPLGVEVTPPSAPGVQGLVAALGSRGPHPAVVGAPAHIVVAGAPRACLVGESGEGYARAARLAIAIEPTAAAPGGLIVLLTWGIGAHGALPSPEQFRQRPELGAALDGFVLVAPQASVTTAPAGLAELDPVALSREHYAESVTLAWVFGGVLVLGGLAAGAAAFAVTNNATELAQVGALALASLAVGSGVLAYARRLTRRVAPFFEVLAQHPADIVWVYARARTGAPPGARVWVNLATIHRRTEMLSVVGAARAEAVLRAITAQAPSATVGWSWSLTQQFARDPGSLRRNG